MLSAHTEPLPPHCFQVRVGTGVKSHGPRVTVDPQNSLWRLNPMDFDLRNREGFLEGRLQLVIITVGIKGSVVLYG